MSLCNKSCFPNFSTCYFVFIARMILPRRILALSGTSSLHVNFPDILLMRTSIYFRFTSSILQAQESCILITSITIVEYRFVHAYRSTSDCIVCRSIKYSTDSLATYWTSDTISYMYLLLWHFCRYDWRLCKVLPTVSFLMYIRIYYLNLYVRSAEGVILRFNAAGTVHSQTIMVISSCAFSLHVN